MKHLLLIASLLFIGQIMNAQEIEKYEITPEGWTTGFIVKECEGKTAQELYDATALYLDKNYASPENVTRNPESKFIRVTIAHTNLIEVQKTVNADMRVTYGFEFKDGKMKIDASSISIDCAGYPYLFQGGALQHSFYNKKGEPRTRSEDHKLYFENYLNDVINSLHQSVCTGAENKSDW